jgi:uncharacterized protein Yka (UPF0111/DUF47 family)
MALNEEQERQLREFVSDSVKTIEELNKATESAQELYQQERQHTRELQARIQCLELLLSAICQGNVSEIQRLKRRIAELEGTAHENSADNLPGVWN